MTIFKILGAPHSDAELFAGTAGSLLAYFAKYFLSTSRRVAESQRNFWAPRKTLRESLLGPRAACPHILRIFSSPRGAGSLPASLPSKTTLQERRTPCWNLPWERRQLACSIVFVRISQKL